MLSEKMSQYWISSGSLPEDSQALDGFVSEALLYGINVFEAKPSLALALSKYPRDTYYLYSQCDIYELAEGETVDDYLLKQLSDCGEEYFDIYCLSYINEATEQDCFAEFMHAEALLNARRKGTIRYAGIFHTGLAQDFYRFIDMLPDNIDFCAAYINYIDWFGFESAIKAMSMRMQDVSVVAIDPLKSGILESVSEEVRWAIHEMRPDCEPLDWAINWINAGSKTDHIVINPTGTADLRKYYDIYMKGSPLTAEEECFTLTISDLIKGIPENHYWACINCNHCASECPAGLNIGYLMTIYKNLRLHKNDKLIRQYRSIPESTRAFNCIACGSCVYRCQERLSVPEYLSDLEKISMLYTH